MVRIKYLLLLTCLFILTSCVTPSNKKLEKINIIDMPESIEIGKFDQSEIKMELIYSDNSTKIENVTESIIPDEHKHYLYEEGQHTFSFIYRGVEVEFSVLMYELKYTITFKNILNEIVKVVNYCPGDEIIYPSDEEMYVEGYKFLGVYDNDLSIIESDVEVIGKYVKVWTVGFYNGKGELISSQIVEDGKSAIEPSSEEVQMEDYKFIAWDAEFTKVTSNLYIYGIYEKLKEDEEKIDSIGLEYQLNSDEISYSVLSVGTCQDLEINIPKKYNDLPVTGIKRDAFSDCEVRKIFISENISNIENYAIWLCHSLTSIEVANNNEYFASIDGVLFTKNKDKLVAYPSAKSDLEYTIPESVTNMWNGAFAACNNLESVIISKNIYEISAGAFQNCTNLKKVVFNKESSIRIIDNFAFRQCIKLETIEFPTSVEQIKSDAFSACVNLSEIIFDENCNIKKIEDYAFMGCNISNIYLPKSIESLGANAFSFCYNLKNVIFEDGSIIDLIDHEAFRDCTSLESIIIPNSVKYIGYKTFSGCENLKTVFISNSVSEIGEWIFYDCINLENVTFEDNTSLTEFNFSWFYGRNNLKKLEIPLGIKSLTGSLYDGIEEYSLDYIYIPDTVESFSSPCAIFVFYESDEIPKVIPNTPYYTDVSIDEFRDTIKNIVKIDYIYYLLNDATFTAKALLNVDVESDIIIPEKISNNNVLYKVTIIDSYIFVRKTPKSFELPNSIVKIENIDILANNIKMYYKGTLDEWCSVDKCIDENSNILHNVEICSTNLLIKYLIENGYDGTSDLNLNIDFRQYIDELLDYGNSDFSEITGKIDNNIYMLNGQNEYYEIEGEIIIPETITSFDEGEFGYFSKITSIRTNDIIKKIGKGAFIGCINLEYVEFISNTDQIEDYAFACCLNMREICIESSNVSSIGLGAFYGCIRLENLIIYSYEISEIYIKSSAFAFCFNLENLEISENIKSIGELAFLMCGSLERLNLSDSLLSVENGAFMYCFNLREIVIPYGVAHMGIYVFIGCIYLEINCEVDPIPNNWPENWDCTDFFI